MAAVLLGGIVVAFVIALQAALGWLGGGPLTTAGQPAGPSSAPHTYVVKPGDTLWSIALGAGTKGDIRPVVDQLSAEVGGRPLQIGQHITIP